MRVAALYDIHGNLPALDAVLEDVRRAGADRVVVGGDVVPGPMAREALDRLLALDVPTEFIAGNCEVAMLAEAAGGGDSTSRLPEAVRQTLRWSAQQFDPALRGVIAEWPKTVQFSVPGLGEVLFCHGTPRDENEIFTHESPDARLEAIFGSIAASVVVCGHIHIQFDRPFGSLRIVNAGSVGMPFDAPGAYWLLLGPEIELRRTDYNRADAAARIRSTPYPQAEEFAAKYVLDPPTARQMLDMYGAATKER
jgi:predicted phosphodiesterase